LSLLYGLVVRCRNLYYDRTPGAARQAGLPVISVGNLTVGGTGKTPLVIEIVRRLGELGRRPAVLTRGYRGSPDQPADEVLELREALPDVPVIVNPDRVAAAASARADHAADCAVLDDGFQHRRLRRDLDIVLVDALRPWGGGWLLPAGRLREPLTSLSRANLVVISRGDQANPATLEGIRNTLRRYAPHVPVARADTQAGQLVQLDGTTAPAGELASHTALPVSGIGNPGTFHRLLDTLAGRICTPLVFSDHHRYTSRDVDAVTQAARERRADVVVTTRKDWVKLAPLWKRSAVGNSVELVRLDVRLVVTEGADALDDGLKKALEAGS
jgi:tetraacyldisaccharide 4'-kinase